MHLFKQTNLFMIAASLLFNMKISAQIIFTRDAESLAKAQSKATVENPWSVFNNPANIAEINSVELGINHSMPIDLIEFSTQSITIVVPINNSGIGIGHQEFGYKYYKEQVTTISYGLKISEKVKMGLGVYRYAAIFGNGYGKRIGISSNFGLAAKLSRKSEFYFMAQNVANSSLENYKLERPGMSQAMGLKVEVGEQLHAIFEMEKFQDAKIVFKSSLSYDVSQTIDLYLGLAIVPNSPSFGTRMNFHQMSFSVGMLYDIAFGLRTGLSITYKFHKR